MALECALLALASAVGLPATANVHQQSSQVFALPARGRVTLRNINGDVHIRAWDRNEVRVDALKTASCRSGLNDALVLVDAGKDAISIRTRYAGGANANPGTVDLTVMVPRDARLSEIEVINGGLDIEGVRGGVNASSVNGPVRAQKIAGNARLSTVNGRLEASFERLGGAKTISMHSVNGPISLSIPYDAGAELDARNVTGGIDNDFGIPVSRDHAAGSQLHGVVKGGGTHINLDNINGPIFITPMAHGRRVKFT